MHNYFEEYDRLLKSGPSPLEVCNYFLVDAYGPFYSHCHPSELGVLLECHQSSNGHVQVQKAKKKIDFQLVVQKSRRESAHARTLAGDFE